VIKVVSALRNIIIPAGALILLTLLTVGQVTTVHGHSMQPGFRPNDLLVVEKVSLYWREPHHNEIVVLSVPETEGLTIKRVVGLPGDLVEIQQGHIFINSSEVAPPFDIAPRWRVVVGGTEVDAPSRFGDSQSSYGPATLADDNYFVLGDNRDNSIDSRSYGPVPRDTIKGRVLLRYWPPHRFTVFR